jgi:hypothetical protein
MRARRPACQGVAMADPLTAPRSRRRWPRPSSVPVRTDFAVGFVVFMVEGMAYLVQETTYGWVG